MSLWSDSQQANSKVVENGAISIDLLQKEEVKIAGVRYSFDQQICRNGHLEPTLERIGSQLCTASQFYSPLYKKWCDKFNEPPRMHRKQWEYVYILQALESAGALDHGRRGLGFGCGREPLSAVMVSRGCDVLATDLDVDRAAAQGWRASNEHAAKLEELFWPGACDIKEFMKRAAYQSVDMNAIPETLVDWDFVWSSCALEHLGSIEKGIEFVVNSTRCLKPGGVAVHTTEYNLSSNDDTFEDQNLVLFRKRDIEKLVHRLESNGCSVEPLNLVIGERVEDGFVDLPPFKSEPHLKLALHGYVATSIGIIVGKL
jgi:SAM-dependent methyltransferase